jgi:hypothetical protein
MIYDQLVRVNQIDEEISQLHQQLGELYRERKVIVSPPTHVGTDSKTPARRLQWKRHPSTAKKGKLHA